MSDFGDVGRFHNKFGLHSAHHDGYGPTKYADDQDVLRFRLAFMREELDEFVEGMDEKDDAKMLDALVDLVYVAMGTAHLMGYPWEEAWREVQRTNMLKMRASPDGSDSKRHSEFDVIKPEGWTPPEIGRILAEYGY